MPQWLRKPILTVIGSDAVAGVVPAMKWVFGIISVFFLDAVRRTMQMGDRHDNVQGGAEASLAVIKDTEAKMFRAQRNIYLAGSTLVLLVILNRLYSLSCEVVVLTASNESMKRQAQNSSEFAAQLLANEKDDSK